jgi:hypothetical protein
MSGPFVLVAVLLASGAASARDGETPASQKLTPRPRRAVLVVMDEVVERLLPRFVDAPRDESRRVSVKDGLVGLGSYSPRGGEGYGVKGPPIHLFPRAGAGQSLNVDPITGRSYFGWP